MTDEHADVLVIGAGASGGAVARRLSDAGLRIVCLEQGGWPDRSTFPGATPEWELVAAKKWSGYPHVRSGRADYPMDLASSEFGVLNYNGVGGGTVLYNAQWPRMLPEDFRVGTTDGIADDWPLTYEELLPFAPSDPARGFVRGAKWALSSAGGPMKAVFGAPLDEGVWGPRHHDYIAARLGKTVSWAILVEDLPEDHNCVELADDLVDHHGLPAPKITYRLSDNSQRNMAFQIERATESLTEAGAWFVRATRHAANGHLMGTARMGNDRESSVVDRWCVAHDVENLLIVDGSVFVTAGAGNPTSTITALALRAADNLLEIKRDLVRPERTHQWTVPERFPARAPDAEMAVGLRANARLTPPQRDRLASLAEVLIPANSKMPPAGSIVSKHLDRVLEVRPDLLTDLVAELDESVRNSAGEASPRIAEGGSFQTLRYVVAAAYYLDSAVRDALGYPGAVAKPVQTLAYPTYLEEGLLDHLV